MTAPRGRGRVAVCAAAVVVLFGATAGGYVLLGSRWPDGAIVMHLQLGSSGGALNDGCPDWGGCAERALAIWNGYLGTVDFRVARDSTAPTRDGNGINNVSWSDTIYGDPFGSDTLAVTLWWRRGSLTTEGDVVFNNRFEWNSYRGPWRGSVKDFRRVAVHEFGHVLGLGHPDEAGQSVQAVMNSRVGSVETPQNDDMAGVQALYGASSPASPASAPPLLVEFPPRDQSMNFRLALESKYRDDLRRASGSSYADIEGSLVWTQEYLRYRVNLCGHADATTRVFMQIDGQGIQPVCGIPRGTQVTFPPRNEPFEFRNALEGKYRDGLRRSPSSTHVDVEGDVVWIQEYLRYRVNRCGHQQALDRVMTQIDGRGIQPTC